MLGTLNIITKGVVGVTVMMWVRWTLPRLRIDQVITTCLKYCVPIAAVMFLGATWWQYAMPNRSCFGIFEVPANVYELAERWPNAAPQAPAAKSAPTASGRIPAAHQTALANNSRMK